MRASCSLRFTVVCAVMLGGVYASAAFGADGQSPLPLCIVYPFEVSGDVASSELAELQSRYAAALTAVGAYRVLSGLALQAQLKAVAFEAGSSGRQAVDAVRAARAVRARWAVFGDVRREGERYILECSIADADAVRILRRVRSRFTGDFTRFVGLAPAQNIQSLLLLAEPPGTQAPTGPAAPSVTSVAPPRPAPAAPTVRPMTPALPPREGGARTAAVAGTEWERAWMPVRERLAGRLTVGTRITTFSLMKDHKDTFLGTIDSLKANQNLLPFKLFAAWQFTKYLGAEISRETYSIDTVTKWDGHHDGRMDLSGFFLSVVGRYPNATRLTPYAALGFGVFDATFKAEQWWGLGYYTKQDWEAAGRSSEPYRGVTRNMDLDASMAVELRAGCDLKVDDRFSATAFLRYVDLDVDDHYYIAVNGITAFDRGVSSFPLSNIGFGVGICYTF